MALPTGYTETTFKDYLNATLGATATVLGWSVVGGNYDEALNSTLFTYPVTDITTVTGLGDLRKLRTLGRVEVWRAVIAEVSADYDFKADGGDYKRSQVFDHAQAMFDAAVTEAITYDGNYAVSVGALTPEYDPYARITATEYSERIAELTE